MEQLMTAMHAPLAASIGPIATGTRTVVLLVMGTAAVLALYAWRRRREAGRDPLRRLAPQPGPLRLARKLTMRSATD